MSVDRQKKVVVRQDGDHVHEEHVVEDVNLENRQVVYKVTQFVWLLFGLLEALIGFRILLKIIGANPQSWFAAFVYQLSDVFLWPFQGIIADPGVQGFVFEISSVIALFVYAFVGWAIVRVIWLVFYRRPTSSVTVYDRDEI
jgi:uncharacterized protein YggT (Ycf19 family)